MHNSVLSINAPVVELEAGQALTMTAWLMTARRIAAVCEPEAAVEAGMAFSD